MIKVVKFRIKIDIGFKRKDKILEILLYTYVKLFILYSGVKSGFLPLKYISSHLLVSLNIGNSFSSQFISCFCISLEPSNHKPVKYLPSLFINISENPFGV